VCQYAMVHHCHAVRPIRECKLVQAEIEATISW
jgi:hypothetical protein